jgi:hypothetical protein
VHIEAHAGASVSVGTAPPPPVVVYQPLPSAPPPQVVIVAPPPHVLVRPVPPPPPPRFYRSSEWGLNLRAEGVIMGSRHAQDAGMGGVGLSLRYRPVPAFAFDFGVDVLGGRDYNGYDRAEIPLSLSGLIFVNPRSRVQFYFIGGGDWSHAKVSPDADTIRLEGYRDPMPSRSYSYLGGHGGIGLEFRLSHRVALNIDTLGFVRTRVDKSGPPEFIDERGRTTNTSGGGLFRGGITFWW